MQKKVKVKIKPSIKEKTKNHSDRNLIILCVFIVVVFIAIMSGSYALINIKISGNKTNFLKTAIFDVVFDDESEYINLTNEGPETDAEGMKNTPYTFTITNNGNIKTTNKIYFSDITGTLPEEYLKLAYKIDDEDYSSPLTMAEFDKIIDDNKILLPGESVRYSIVLWVSDENTPDSENSNSLMNTNYKSKITVESSQKLKTTILSYSNFTNSFIDNNTGEYITNSTYPNAYSSNIINFRKNNTYTLSTDLKNTDSEGMVFVIYNKDNSYNKTFTSAELLNNEYLTFTSNDGKSINLSTDLTITPKKDTKMAIMFLNKTYVTKINLEEK